MLDTIFNVSFVPPSTRVDHTSGRPAGAPPGDDACDRPGPSTGSRDVVRVLASLLESTHVLVNPDPYYSRGSPLRFGVNAEGTAAVTAIRRASAGDRRARGHLRGRAEWLQKFVDLVKAVGITLGLTKYAAAQSAVTATGVVLRNVLALAYRTGLPEVAVSRPEVPPAVPAAIHN